MKKNLLGAVIIFFVTIAFLLMINDIVNNGNNPQLQDNVEVYDAGQQQGLVITDY